jgi:hypothetical protein
VIAEVKVLNCVDKREKLARVLMLETSDLAVVLNIVAGEDMLDISNLAVDLTIELTVEALA